MPRNTPAPDTMPPEPRCAHLVIHASTAPAGPSLWAVPLAWLNWLRGLTMAITAPCPLRLLIDDLQGQRVFTAEDAGPQLALELPAGTYQVTAIHGPLCRGYTLTLVADAPNHLYLCPSLCGSNTSPREIQAK